jgi:catechol 2,3-dioxygenase-like lactoylglutathione lyase family enzyme
VGEWYTKHLGLEVLGSRKVGDGESQALGTSDRGMAIILLPGDPLEHPKRLQIHFHVTNVDVEYKRLQDEGVKFDEPPEDKPRGWRHAYTRDPLGHTVEICSPLPNASFEK